MSKQIVYGDASRQGILRGVNSLANVFVLTLESVRAVSLVFCPVRALSLCCVQTLIWASIRPGNRMPLRRIVSASQKEDEARQ